MQGVSCFSVRQFHFVLYDYVCVAVYYYAIAFVCEYLLVPIIYLLQAIVFWLLWFGTVVCLPLLRRFVGSPPLLSMTCQVKLSTSLFHLKAQANQYI